MACRGSGHGKSMCVIAKSWQHTQGYAQPQERALSDGLHNSSGQAGLTLPGCCHAAGQMSCAICVEGITLAVLGIYTVQHAEQRRWQQAGQVSGRCQSCAGACIPASQKQHLNRGWQLTQTLHLAIPEQLSRRGVTLLPGNEASRSISRHS